MDFAQYLISIRDVNEAEMEALKIAAAILRRAQELPLQQRPFMLALVQELIAVHERDCHTE